MKIYLGLYLGLVSISAYANNDFFCLTNSNQKVILLVPANYPDTDKVQYYPYLKDIKISKPIKTNIVDMGEGAKPEIYRTVNEIFRNKITGNYTFMSQGYLIYKATYVNKRNNKKTSFVREHELILKGVNCL